MPKPDGGWALNAIMNHTRPLSAERTAALNYMHSAELFLGARWCSGAMRALTKDFERIEGPSFDGAAMSLMSSYYAQLITAVGEAGAKEIKQGVIKELKLEVRL